MENTEENKHVDPGAFKFINGPFKANGHVVQKIPPCWRSMESKLRTGTFKLY